MGKGEMLGGKWIGREGSVLIGKVGKGKVGRERQKQYQGTTIGTGKIGKGKEDREGKMKVEKKKQNVR